MVGGFDNNNTDCDVGLFDIGRGLGVTGLLEVRVVIAVDAIVVDDAVDAVDVVVVEATNHPSDQCSKKIFVTYEWAI
jgi:hypothetical protein